MKKKTAKKPVKKTAKKVKALEPTADEIALRDLIFDRALSHGQFVELSKSEVLVFGKHEFSGFCIEMQQMISAFIKFERSEAMEMARG
jgi:hypothetical protein